MAVIVRTGDVVAFLQALKDIFDQEAVKTWIRDGDGDFTHAPDQWKNKAWMRRRAPNGGAVVFNLLGQKGVTMTKTVYAVYHGRFAEMLLAHLDTKIDAIELSATRHPGDNYS